MPQENTFKVVPFENNFKVDLSESDIKQITESAELDDSNAEILATVFESAVNTKVSEISEAMTEHYSDQTENFIESYSEQTADQIGSFLDAVVDEWIEENTDSVDAAIRNELNTDLVEGLMTLLKDSYFEIPEDRKDLVEEMSSDIKELENEVSELEEANDSLNLAIKGKSCEDIVSALSEELTDTQTEKFVQLIEDFDIDDVDVFSKKAKIIRESLFGKSTKLDESENHENSDNINEDLPAKDENMSYADSILLKSRNIK